jgi:L-lactate dehydrogenase complex protein LldG
MTSNERAAMRHAIGAAVARARLPGAPLEHPGRLRLPGDPAGARLARFTAQFTALGGAVHELEGAAAVADLVASLAIAEAARPHAASSTGSGDPVSAHRPSVLMWNDDQLPLRGLAAELGARGVGVLPQSDADMRVAARKAELAGALVGLTGAEAGLAETGSIVLASGSGRGRIVSLLPPIHVALLERRLLVEALADLMADRPDLWTSGSNVVCITGPSRTADIEHTLSKGVHGPREVHVVILGRDESTAGGEGASPGRSYPEL